MTPPSDIDQIATGFMNARSWLADVREHADPHVTCILVGNKVDLCDDNQDGVSHRIDFVAPLNFMQGAPSKPRQVSTEEGADFARQEGLLFVEASAKSGLNVELAFVEAATDILQKVRNGVFDDSRVSFPWFL